MSLLLDVKHQSGAQRALQRALKYDRVPHSYIFHGPAGVGKERLAHAFAQLLLCAEPAELDALPDDLVHLGTDRYRSGCGNCKECHLLAVDTHPDLHVIHRHLNRYHPDTTVQKRKAMDLGVDIVRYFLIAQVGHKPTRGRAKIFIVREADRVTPAAANAMLKTLEEPPAATYIILLVESVDRLLPTTVSRCQQVAFSRLPLDFVAARLTESIADLPSEQAVWYARFAQGSLGLALQYAQQGLFQINQAVIMGLAKLCLPLDCGSGFQPVNCGAGTKGAVANFSAWSEVAKSLSFIYKQGDEEISDAEATRRGFKSILAMAVTFFADVMRHGTGVSQSCLNVGVPIVSDLASRISPTIAADLVRRITNTERQLDQNANVQLCIETLINDIRATTDT